MGDYKTITNPSSGTTPTVPNAPNILGGASAPVVTVTYGLVCNVSCYGYSIAGINLPTTDPAYTSGHLKKIHISEQTGSAVEELLCSPLYGPWSSSPISATEPVILDHPQPTSSTSKTLIFSVENDDGIISSSPVTVSVTIQASAAATPTAGDASASGSPHPKARYPDGNGSLHVPIWFSPAFVGAQVPQVAPVMVNKGDGNGWSLWEQVRVDTVGQVFYLVGDAWAPTVSAQTWQIACGAGWYNGDPNPGSTLPAGFVACSAFSVATVGAASATAYTLSFQNNGSGVLYDYSGPFDPGYYTWRFHDLRIAFPASDPNLEDILFFAQEGTVSGGVFTPLSDPSRGAKRQFMALLSIYPPAQGPNGVTGGVQSLMGQTIDIAGPTVAVSGAQVPDWSWPSPVPAGWVCRISAASLSRYDPTGTGVQTQTTLTGWAGGADHFDLTPTQQAAALDLRRALTSSIGPGLTKDAVTLQPKLATTTPNNLVMNPSFEDGMAHWAAGAGLSQIATAFAYGGANSLMLAGNGSSPAYVRSDKIQVKPTEVYYIEVYLWSDTAADGTAQVAIEYTDWMGAYVTTQVPLTGITPPGNVWTKYSGTFTVPATASWMDISPQIVSNTGTSTTKRWWVDSLYLVRQVSTGPGTTPDGQGGVKLQTVATAAVAVDSFGNVYVKAATGVATDSGGNLYVNQAALAIAGFTGNLDVSRVANLAAIAIGSFAGNLDVSRVNNLYNLNVYSFQGNLDVSRVANLSTFSITNFAGNLDISRVTNITTINIGTLSGTLNVTYQVADGSIPINKIATLYVSNIYGWSGATINVGSGMTFSGSGGIYFTQGAGTPSVTVFNAFVSLADTSGTGTIMLAAQTGQATVRQLWANGSWSSPGLVLGGWRMWVDSSGRLRICGYTPASDTDGVVVGTQS